MKKVLLTASLLLFTSTSINFKKDLTPKEERLIIERSLDKSEKELMEISRIIKEQSILKNK